ncbi:DUF6759 domain-containing protein [Kaistella palustris]|uniref:DUF6759 domain-containing protein n=1 Tax=Kaistella palustris TaxID=493376 RepID=UPI000685F50A|nr:DUF6759 domain-containing protein [Kaistella palustris]
MTGFLIYFIKENAIFIFYQSESVMKYCFFFLLLLMVTGCEISTIPNTVYRNSSTSTPAAPSAERSEFQELMEKDKINKKQVNAAVLTYLLNDTDPRETETAAVVENASNCNIILRLVGISNSQIYNLPIAAHSKNQFVLRKGNYTLRSTVCGAVYYSQKVISDPLILKLSAQ